MRKTSKTTTTISEDGRAHIAITAAATGAGKKAVWRHNDAMCLTHGYLAYARARACKYFPPRTLTLQNVTITWVKKRIDKKKPRFIPIHQDGKRAEGDGHVKRMGWSRRKANRFCSAAQTVGMSTGALQIKSITFQK